MAVVAMPLTISYRPVVEARELYVRADKDLKREMQRVVRQGVTPWLQSAIRRNASTSVERKLAGTAKIRSGTRPAVVVGSTGKFHGGARSRDIVAAYEFGTISRYGKSEYERRNRASGGTHRVKRATRVQLPDRDDGGRFIYPAVKQAAPELVGAWIAVIMDAYEYQGR